MSKRSTKSSILSKAFEKRMERVQLIGFIGLPVLCMLVLLACVMWQMNR